MFWNLTNGSSSSNNSFVWDSDIRNSSDSTSTETQNVNVGNGVLRFSTSVLIITVNILTRIVTFCRVQSLRTLSNMLMVSLAVTDLMVGLIVFLSALSWIPVLNPILNSLPEAACLVRLCWFFVCCCVSMITICMIAGERYLYIVHPYKHVDYVTTKVVVNLIIASWTVGLIFGLAPLFIHRFRVDLDCDLYDVLGPVYSVYISLSIFLLSCIPTLIFYSLIACLVLQKRRSVLAVPRPLSTISYPASDATSPESSGRSATLRSKLRALKAPVVVFGVFFVCWAPHFTIYVLRDAGIQLPSRTIRAGITNFGFINSGLNFFVYLILNPQFRRTFKQLFTCKTRPQRQ